MNTWKSLIQNIMPELDAFTIPVKGYSMFPIINEGEIVKVVIKNSNLFEIGDILVYPYEKEGFLIHRLLEKKDDLLSCKGDNSFRLEKVNARDVIGVVRIENDTHRNQEFVDFSLFISMLHSSNGYNTLITKSLKEYKEYKRRYLNSL